jgi:hypothetical protein
MSRHTFGFAVRAMIFFLFSQAAFYPHSLVSDIRSVLGGCSRSVGAATGFASSLLTFSVGVGT